MKKARGLLLGEVGIKQFRGWSLGENWGCRGICKSELRSRVEGTIVREKKDLKERKMCEKRQMIFA